MTLLESLFLLLNEGNRTDYILANRPKLLDGLYERFESDDSFDMNVAKEKGEELAQKIENKEENPEVIKKEIIRYILDQIEQKFQFVKKSLEWVIKNYKESRFKYEDLPRVDEQLQKFDRMKVKKKLQEPDLNKYDFDKFIETINSVSTEELKTENQRRKEAEEASKEETSEDAVIKGDYEIVWNKPDLIVYHPFTYEAERAVTPRKDSRGHENGWCTAAGPNGRYNGPSMFQRYNSQGPLLPMYDKKEDRWYQLHFESDSFMDFDDQSVGKGYGDEKYNDFLKKHPEIEEFISAYIRSHPYIVKKYSNWKKYLNTEGLPKDIAEYLKTDLSDTEYITKMNQNGTTLSRKLQKMLIDANATNIKRMIKVPEDLQIYALKKDPHAFKRNCSPEMRQMILRADPRNIVVFDDYKTRDADGNIIVKYAKDYLTDKDIKLALAQKPELIYDLATRDYLQSFFTRENIQYALQKDLDKEYQDRIDILIYKYLPDDLKTWYKEELNKKKAE